MLKFLTGENSTGTYLAYLAPKKIYEKSQYEENPEPKRVYIKKKTNTRKILTNKKFLRKENILKIIIQKENMRKIKYQENPEPKKRIAKRYTHTFKFQTRLKRFVSK